MKNTEFKSLAMKLLDPIARFEHRGDSSIMLPISHTLRSIVFDRSIDKRAFYLYTILQPLFVPQENLTLDIGWRLGGDCHTWNADDPSLIEELTPFIEREAVPFLSLAVTPIDVAECALSLNAPGNLNVVEAVGYSCARGADYDRAVQYLDCFVDMLGDDYEWERRRKDNALLLRSLILDDPDKAQYKLLEWEAHSAKHLKIASLRQPG